MIELSALCRRYTVRRLNEADIDDILRLCRMNKLYYSYCGKNPFREQIVSDMIITPPGIDRTDKYYIGFFCGDGLAAVMDLIDGYPDKKRGYIGFFMMNAGLQGKGIGTEIIQDVCTYLRQYGKTAVNLAVAKDNPQANHFWRKNGFIVERD